MSKKTRKFFAGMLTLAMILTSFSLPANSKRAAAAPLNLTDEEYNSSNLLSGVSGDILTSTKKGSVKGDGTVHVDEEGNYDGYIVTDTGKAKNAKYLKITYTIADTASLNESSKLFNFQPFDSSSNGWQDNFITYGDAISLGENSYKSYIAVRSIKESMKEDQTCYGINLSFYSETPTITLTGYEALTVKATKNETVQKYDSDTDADLSVNTTVKEITGTELDSAGINVDNLINNKTKVTPYVQVTKAHDRSRISFSCVTTSNGSSNKEIAGTGRDGYSNGATGTDYVIHCGYGGNEGTGKGAAGTGIYNTFPSLDTAKWSGQDKSGVSLRLQVRTKDTECKLLGVVFADGQAITVEDGGSIKSGFDTSGLKLESGKPDSTDVKPKSEAELKSEAEDDLWEAIRSAKAVKAEDCLTEDLYSQLQTAITEAQTALDSPDATSATLTSALEKLNGSVKNATNEAPLGLKKAIEYCSFLKEEDYSADSFAKLAPAIAAAEEVYAAAGSKSDSELKSARDALEAVRVALVPKVSSAESDPKDFRILSKKEVIAEMGAGINLGNTMDGGLYEVTETNWQAYKTTKAYIKALHDAGYNTVRIPVTWGANINEDYSIKEEWIGRVQEIVDYCVDQDMYAIINIHHDGAANHDNRGNNTPACWLDTWQWNIEKVYQKYEGVWKTIANRFKDYDEHLIFESMNEVTDAHTLGSGQKNEDDAVLSALNQLFINTVRATGSNNTKRWLAITGRFATTAGITAMPEDTLADKGEVGTARLMFAVHIYKANSAVRWTYNNLKEWQSSLSDSTKKVQAFDTSKEMPIYVGEYGVRTQAQSGSETGYNNAERALNYELCAAVSDFYGAVPIVWDQGSSNYLGIETQTGLFTDWDRPNLKPVYDDVVQATIRGTYETTRDKSNLGNMMSAIYNSYGHSSTSDNGISKDPEITPATAITVSDESVSLKAGERKTVTAEADSSRDMVLWTTDDDSIATVSRGLIHAKGIGITTVHAKTQLGAVVKDIKVIVAPSGSETATAVKTDKAYYEMTEGDTLNINTTLTPTDSKDAITYVSSNTNIATVSGSGKVTAENAGNTYIIVTAASGVSTIVNIKVNRKGSSNAVNATLNVMFGSGQTEKSAPVTMTGDGQYTLTFDMEKDLSEDGKNAGLTKLEKLISVFIRDTNTLKPVVSAAKIRYDKVVVNDTELTLKKTADMDEDGFKNLLKSSGQLDSNDPINGWDGCAVEEVSTDSKNHVVSFPTVENPTKISVTFTIKDMKFFPVIEKTKPASNLESVTENKFVISEIGGTKGLELTMTPADTDSEVTFYSTNSAVASVDNAYVMAGEQGQIKTTVTGVSAGTATIVAITENGLKALYTVGVGDMQVSDLAEPVDPTPKGLDGSIQEETPTPTPGGDGQATPTPSPGGDSQTTPTPSPGGDSQTTPTPSPGGDSQATPTPSPGGNGQNTPAPSAKLKVSKTSVIVAAGKTVSVSYTGGDIPSGVKTTLMVKSSNSKVATAVKAAGKKILISVPKKAVKGATAKIKLLAMKETATIKVTVKNPAKKIKAVKKTVKVKKKKNATLKFKVTATNKKKPAADTVKATSKKKKIAKVLSYSVKKGKATVKIKGVKKGKTTITLKIGKKSAKVTVQVK